MAATLGACTLEPEYHRPDLPVANAYPTGEAYVSRVHPEVGRALPPSESEATAADLGWRDFLRDVRLQRLVELALKNNRDLRVAILNVETARAQYGIQRAALLPSVAANANAVRARGSISLFEPSNKVINAFEAYVSVSWELDFFGKVRSLEKAALEQYLATSQARKSAEILLVSEVANQYLTLVADDEALKVTDDTLRVAQESFRLTQMQFDTGTGSELDLREAEGALEQAKAQLAAQKRARAQAENALVLLVGSALPADLPQGDDLEQQSLVTDVPSGLPSDLIERRPDIEQAEYQLMAANANIGAARAAFFPSISLTGVAGSVSPYLHQLFQSGTGSWALEPGITLPIFTGGLNTSNLEQAKAQQAIAVAQYEKTIQTAFREVADGLTARATYEDQVDSLNRLVAAQQRRLQLAQLRYRTGVDSYLTLLTAQTDLNNAQLSRVTTSLDRLTNLVTLYEDLGGGWVEHQGDAPRDSSAPP
ncbi:MAG: efflux transporter outer membrane subunit [Burkholderiaceae bacterium]